MATGNETGSSVAPAVMSMKRATAEAGERHKGTILPRINQASVRRHERP
jgi:hypothetical protein